MANPVPKGYFGEYLTLAFFAGMMLLLVAGTLGLNKLVSPKVHRDEKYLTYECGVDPVGGGWSQTQIRYYLFGLLFVVFDVEAVFLFPWVVVFMKGGTGAFVEMIIFLRVLAPGLAYGLPKKVLQWPPSARAV